MGSALGPGLAQQPKAGGRPRGLAPPILLDVGEAKPRRTSGGRAGRTSEVIFGDRIQSYLTGGRAVRTSEVILGDRIQSYLTGGRAVRTSEVDLRRQDPVVPDRRHARTP
jgi:hypothetical protein